MLDYLRAHIFVTMLVCAVLGFYIGLLLLHRLRLASIEQRQQWIEDALEAALYREHNNGFHYPYPNAFCPACSTATLATQLHKKVQDTYTKERPERHPAEGTDISG
jgi:hypothetical protein